MPLSAIAKRKLANAQLASKETIPPTTSTNNDNEKDLEDQEEIAFNAILEDSKYENNANIVVNDNVNNSLNKVPKKKKAKLANQRYFKSATNDEEYQPEEELIQKPKKRRQKASHYDYNCVSNFDTNDSTSIFDYDKHDAWIGLSDYSTLILAGRFTLRVLKGTLRIYGIDIESSNSLHEVYAPTCYPLPSLSVSSSNSSVNDAQIPQSISHHDVVIHLSELNTGIDKLGNAISEFKFIWDCPYDGSYSGWNAIRGMYPILEQTPNVFSYLCPPSWLSSLELLRQRSLNSIDPFVCVVKGSKNTGKSTYTRSLFNTLKKSHRKIAYLECDIGQSEFMPSGSVSLTVLNEYLLGPPSTHPRIPVRAHFLGHASPVSDPDSYVRAIEDLISYYYQCVAHQNHQTDDYIPIPLVINTQGWIRGLGAEMMESILDIIGKDKCTLIELSNMSNYTSNDNNDDSNFDNVDNENEDDITNYITDKSSIKIDSIANSENPMLVKYTPTDYRNLMMTTYLHAHLNYSSTVIWDFSRPLCSIPPLRVNYENDIKYVGIFDGEDVTYDNTLVVMNGSIVALNIDDDTENDKRLVRNDENVINFQKQSTLGLGIVRSVDIANQQLHILTPLSINCCKLTNVLVKGKLDLPVQACIDWTVHHGDIEWSNVPYLSVDDVVGEGGQKRKIRRTIQRKPAQQ